MKEISRAFVILALFIFGTQSVSNANKDVLEDEVIAQEKIKKNVIEVLEKKYGDLEGFLKKGTMYWENGVLKIGLKPEENKDGSVKIEKEFSKVRSVKSNIEVVDIKYSTQDLIDKIPEIEKEYVKLEGKDNLITIGTREDIQKLEISVKSINKKSKRTLLNKFGSLLLINEDPSLNKPKAEISRRRDWTVLGGGIAGITNRNKDFYELTATALAEKNGAYYMITAGHGITQLNGPFYQYNSLVGYQHTDATIYNKSDIGLIRLADSTLESAYGKVKRRVSNRLYLNDESNDNYSGRISAVRSWISVGDVVSKSGLTTGVTDGKITSTNMAVYYQGTPTVYCAQVSPIDGSKYSRSGDSGAPTYMHSSGVNKTLVGVHSGGDGVHGYFAPVNQLYSSFGSDFRVITNYNEIYLD